VGRFLPFILAAIVLTAAAQPQDVAAGVGTLQRDPEFGEHGVRHLHPTVMTSVHAAARLRNDVYLGGLAGTAPVLVRLGRSGARDRRFERNARAAPLIRRGLRLRLRASEATRASVTVSARRRGSPRFDLARTATRLHRCGERELRLRVRRSAEAPLRRLWRSGAAVELIVEASTRGGRPVRGAQPLP
jgi:hypothetical protein